MIGFAPFRSLHSVMIVTIHVAVISYALRSFTKPDGPGGSVAVWVPLSILLALFLSMPMGRAVAAAFGPGDGSRGGRCPGCGRGELRPLLRSGAGLFAPVVGYRCAGCKTTYRPVGEAIIEEPAPGGPGAAGPEGILFEPDPPGDDREIRFLDEGPAGLANIPDPPVSEV